MVKVVNTQSNARFEDQMSPSYVIFPREIPLNIDVGNVFLIIALEQVKGVYSLREDFRGCCCKFQSGIEAAECESLLSPAGTWR